jgi:hypothetical protein
MRGLLFDQNKVEFGRLGYLLTDVHGEERFKQGVGN